MIHDIDKQRFRIVLQWGVRADEAKSFLKDNRLALITAGAPLDNVPSDPQVIYRVIEGFSNKANRLFGKWLLQRSNPTKPLPIPQLVLRWRAVEELGIIYDDSEKTSLGQQALCELFATTPNEAWLGFLRTPIAKPIADRITISPEEWLTLTTALLAKERVKERVKERIGGGSVGWADAVVDIVGAVLQFDSSSLSPLSPYAPVLGEIRSTIELSRPIVVTPAPLLPMEPLRGVKANGPELRSFDSSLDYTDFTVIATNRTPRDVETYLLFVEGFVDETGNVFRLSEEDLRKAIPTIGRIILHPERIDVPPQYGEPNAYAVERFPTENKVKVKAVRRLYDVLCPVVSVPHSSADAHRIRDYITDYAKRHLSSVAVFVSADKLCLMPRVAALQKVLAPDFDWQLDLWDALDAIELQNGPHVLNLALRPAQKSLNCAPLANAARKLLRIYTERSQVKLARSAREQLIELIEQDDLRFDEATKARLKANLEAIGRGTDDFNELVGLLLQTQTVKEEVERRITAEVELRVAERDKTKRELDQLRTQRTQLERRIADLSAEAVSKAAGVRTAMQRAFQQARENGIATLADMALFDVFLSRAGGIAQLPAIAVAAPSSDALPNETLVETLSASGKEVRDVFRRFGVDEPLSDRLAAVLLLTRAGGSPIVVSGTGASALGIALGTAMSRGSCVSVTLGLGLISDQHFEKRVPASKADVLILRQGNVSEVSLYARSLLDEVVRRMMSHSDSPPFAIVLIDVGGAAALPWPSEIVESAVAIDLDAITGQLELNAGSEPDGHGWLRRRVLAHYARLAEDLPGGPEALADLYRLVVARNHLQ